MRSPMHSTVFRAIAWDKASKSNIGTRLVALAVGIGCIEEVSHIQRDGILEAGEAAIVAGALQPIRFALREILVAAANSLGHVDKSDIGVRPERRIGRDNEILEAARPAGSDIEQ